MTKHGRVRCALAKFLIVATVMVSGCATLMRTSTSIRYTSYGDEFTQTYYEQIEFGSRKRHLAFRVTPGSSSFVVGYHYMGSDWLFIDRLTLLADGQRISLTDGRHDRRVASGAGELGGQGVREWVTWKPSASDMGILAAANEIRYQVRGSRGKLERELDSNQVDALHAFIVQRGRP